MKSHLWERLLLALIVSASISTQPAFADGNDDRDDHPDHSVRAGLGAGGSVQWNESTSTTSVLDPDTGDISASEDDNAEEVTEDNREGTGHVELNLEYVNPYVFGTFDTNFATTTRGRLLLTPSYLAVGGDIDIGTGGESATVNGTGQIGVNYMDRNFRGFLVGLVGTDTPDLSDDETVAFSQQQLMAIGVSGRAEFLLEDVNFILGAEYRGMLQVDKDNLDLNRTEVSAHQFDVSARLEVPVIPVGPTSVGLFAEAGYGYTTATARVFDAESLAVVDYERNRHEVSGSVGLVFYWDSNLEGRREGRERSRSSSSRGRDSVDYR